MRQQYAINGATVRAAVEFGNLELEVRKLFSELEFLETWKFEVGLTDSYKLNFENMRFISRRFGTNHSLCTCLTGLTYLAKCKIQIWQLDVSDPMVLKI